jgi:hypothetical protein
MYYQVNADLSDGQLKKLAYAVKYQQPVTLQLEKSQLGKGKSELMLTQTQINRLKKAKNAARISFSVTQLKAQTGEGLLDSIIAIGKAVLPKALPILGSLGLAGATGAISGLANKAVAGKKKGGAIVLMVTKDDMKKILQLINQLEENGALPLDAHKVIMEQISRQEGGFIGTLLASLAGPLLANLLGGKGLERAGGGLTRAGSKN